MPVYTEKNENKIFIFEGFIFEDEIAYGCDGIILDPESIGSHNCWLDSEIIGALGDQKSNEFGAIWKELPRMKVRVTVEKI